MGGSVSPCNRRPVRCPRTLFDKKARGTDLIRLFKYCSAILLFAFAATAAAEGSTNKSYSLPNHGSLQLTAPESWHDEVRRPPQGLPPTIVFKPASGPMFVIMITPIYAPTDSKVQPDPKRIRRAVEKDISRIAPQAVEKTIPTQELRGTSGVGYYYFATDKAPAPGEYKYMTQGSLIVGELETVFPVLTNDDSCRISALALAMLKSATQRKP